MFAVVQNLLLNLSKGFNRSVRSLTKATALLTALALTIGVMVAPPVSANGSYGTGQDWINILAPGSSQDRIGYPNNRNLFEDNDFFVGGAYLTLTPTASSTQGNNPTRYGYATENTLVVKKITSVYRISYECLAWGSLFPNTTDLDPSNATSKVPFLYDPALAGKLVEYWVWNQALNQTYEPGMVCDESVGPWDGSGAYGPYNLPQAAFVGQIY